jgi:hypothetical protein
MIVTSWHGGGRLGSRFGVKRLLTPCRPVGPPRSVGKLAKAELRQRGRPSGTERQACILMPVTQTADHALELGGSCGAGDENRTRTISSGSRTVIAVRGADLVSLTAPSDRGCPLVTLAR